MILGLAFLAFTVLVGLVAVGLAVSFAVRPAEAKLAVVRPLSLAVILASVGSIATGLAHSFKIAAGQAITPAGGTMPPGMLFAGIAEAMIVAALGFALIAVVWLLVGIGLHRQP